MRKRMTNKKFNRSLGHRKAMRRNLLQALFEHGRIVTTLPKAKFIRPEAEKMITKAKNDTIGNRNTLKKRLFDQKIVEKLFVEIGPGFVDRAGGYTRITKLGPRRGDATEMAVLEFVEAKAEKLVSPSPEETKSKKITKKKTSK